MIPLTDSAAEIRAIAVSAEAHPKTVFRRISGQPVRGLSALRIDRALTAAGWSPVVVAGEITGWSRGA